MLSSRGQFFYNTIHYILCRYQVSKTSSTTVYLPGTYIKYNVLHYKKNCLCEESKKYYRFSRNAIYYNKWLGWHSYLIRKAQPFDWEGPSYSNGLWRHCSRRHCLFLRRLELCLHYSLFAKLWCKCSKMKYSNIHCCTLNTIEYNHWNRFYSFVLPKLTNMIYEGFTYLGVLLPSNNKQLAISHHF